jgi:hypothetical protein
LRKAFKALGASLMGSVRDLAPVVLVKGLIKILDMKPVFRNGDLVVPDTCEPSEKGGKEKKQTDGGRINPRAHDAPAPAH